MPHLGVSLLRIIRTGSEPGPKRQGVWVYIITVDLALGTALISGGSSRPLDFAPTTPRATPSTEPSGPFAQG
jgi:hypothetical protein